jgi:hypothetical protein
MSIRAELVRSPLMTGGGIYHEVGATDSGPSCSRPAHHCDDRGRTYLVMWLIPSIFMAIKHPEFINVIFEHGFGSPQVPRVLQ